MGSRSWVKIHCDKWLSQEPDSIQQEPPEYRGLWTDMLALAGAGMCGDIGRIEILPGVGPTQEQLADGFSVHLELWQRFEARMIETQRIAIDSKRVIRILNWNEYQSEYGRLRKYKYDKGQRQDTPKGTPKGTPKSTPKGTPKSTPKGTPKSTRRREEKRREETGDSRIPSNKTRVGGTQAASPQKTANRVPVYPPEFNAAWAIHHELRDDQSPKPAFHAWNARVSKDKIPAADLLRATQHFSEAMLMEKRPPDKIMHAAVFFGPNERWRPYLDGIPNTSKQRGGGWAKPSEAAEFKGGDRTDDIA